MTLRSFKSFILVNIFKILTNLFLTFIRFLSKNIGYSHGNTTPVHPFMWSGIFYSRRPLWIKSDSKSSTDMRPDERRRRHANERIMKNSRRQIWQSLCCQWMVQHLRWRQQQTVFFFLFSSFRLWYKLILTYILLINIKQEMVHSSISTFFVFLVLTTSSPSHVMALLLPPQ